MIAVVAYAVILTALHELITFPISWYRGFLLEQRYELSSEPFAAWLRDHAKGFALAAVFAGAIAWGVYRLMAVSPRWWWVLAAIAGALVTLLLARLAPVVLLPLFYTFRPLDRPALEARLTELSTVGAATLSRLDGFFAAGGPENTRRALDLMAHLARLAPDHGLSAEPLPMHGKHRLHMPDAPGRPLAAIVFYRAYLLAADLAPIEALARALAREGLNVRALYVGSLKDRDSANFVAAGLRDWGPQIVLNATAFSARLDDAPSPLEAAGAPIRDVLEHAGAPAFFDPWAGRQ